MARNPWVGSASIDSKSAGPTHQTAQVNEAVKTVMLYSVCYFTSRREPHFEWFMDEFARQSNDLPETQLVLVDYWLAPGHPNTKPEGRMERMAEIVDGRCQFIHVPPKPTPWQGAHRQTTRDWFAASNARNTALIVADGKTFVGVDDLSVPLKGWWDQIRHSAEHSYLAMGAYKKVRQLTVENGIILNYHDDGNGNDSRWGTGSDGGIIPVTGANLYGCCFAMPLEIALRVDGFDEYCNGLGSEDTDFGQRVERTRCPCFYNRNMMTFESAEGHEEEPSFRREKYRVPSDRLPECIRGGFPNGLDSDWVMVRALQADCGRTQPLERNDLKSQRELWRTKRTFREPACGQYHWATGSLLSQL